MTEIEQIGEMAEIIAKNSHYRDETWRASDFEWAAHCLQTAGYRKQTEGEWESVECQCGLFSIYQYFVCSACKQDFVIDGWDYDDLVAIAKFCPNCGAKMKGGE